MARHIRHPTPLSTAPAELPWDVRAMNRLALVFVALALLGALAAAWGWLRQVPWLPIRHIEVQGEVSQHSLGALRSQTLPQLKGNFFSIDLQQSRARLEELPWVRRALVRRVWPDTLRVELEEHAVAALWEGPPDEPSAAPADRLVNVQGEVFEASLAELDEAAEDVDAVADPGRQAQLPRLAGPEGSAAQMLALLRRLDVTLAPLQRKVSRLAQSQRGQWQAELDNGALLTLGRGSEEALLARSERFARTYADVQTRWPQPLEYADLRHADGYALRLRGVNAAANPTASTNLRAGARPVSTTPAARTAVRPR
jgi:cell division protein FtsQ